MSLLLTPERCAAIYECLRAFPPFDKWRLPPAEEVEFRTPNRKDIFGEYIEFDPHIITLSLTNIGHYETAHRVIAHEMLHLSQAIAGTRTKSQHNADWHKRARTVCRHMGWDYKAF